MDLQLAGRTALVTGATTGIGKGIAEALSAEGVRVVVSGRRVEALEAVAAGIANAAGVIAADIAKPDGPRVIAEEALSLLGGRVDILVNNAGASMPLERIDDEEAWANAAALNFDAARRLTHGLVEPMKAARWGRIVTVTGAMVAPVPNAAAPAKSALASWSRSLAIALAPHGITANTIAPGRIDSEQIRNKLHPTEASRQAFIDRFIPAGYFGQPADIANLVAFLASPLAQYVNGAAIPVDGAMLRIA